MGVWKTIGAICIGDIVTGGKLLNARKGGIGYGWLILFIIIYFPCWLIYKILKLIFVRRW